MSTARSRSRSPMDSSEEKKDIGRNTSSSERSSHGPSIDCRVYVSNIPYECKWQELKDFFRSELGDVNFVEMFEDDNGRPRGCAIVDFESPVLAGQAIEKVNKTEIKGRKLILRLREDAVRSRDFSFLFSDKDRDRNHRFARDGGRRVSDNFNRNSSGYNNYGNTYGLAVPFLESLGITGPLVSKVFISNLDFKVRDEDLRDVFKIAGKVSSAEVAKDGDGKSRGFGIVEFDHPVQAVQAISMLNNQIYFDRRLSIRMDRIAEKEQIKGPRKLPHGLKSLGMGLGVNGLPIIDLSDLKNSPCAESSVNMGPPNTMGNMGFNYNGSNSNMGGGGNQSMMNMTPGMESLAVALGLGAQNMLNMANLSVPPPPPPQKMNNYGKSNNGRSNSGLSPISMNNGSNYQIPAGTGLVIMNLPMDYTWKNLKDLCRAYGDVKYAEIKNKGEGWVRFGSEDDTKKAQELIGRHRIDGRALSATIM